MQVKLSLLRYFVGTMNQHYFDPITYQCYYRMPDLNCDTNPQQLIKLPCFTYLETHERYISQLSSEEFADDLRQIYTEYAPRTNPDILYRFFDEIDCYMSERNLWDHFNEWHVSEMRMETIKWCETNHINYIDDWDAEGTEIEGYGALVPF